MLKVWLGCFDDLFSIWNVSYSCYLHVLSTRFLLCSREVLAALSHLHIVVNLGYSVQCLFSRLSLQFQVGVSVHCTQCWVLPANIPWLAQAYCLTITSLRSVLPVAVDCLQPIKSHTWECLACTPTRYGMIWNILCCILRRSVYFLCVSSWLRHQSVISGLEYILYIPMELER